MNRYEVTFCRNNEESDTLTVEAEDPNGAACVVLDDYPGSVIESVDLAESEDAEGVVELAQLLLESEFDTVAEVREYLQKVIKKGDAV
jgi:hypothetical protein